MAVAAVLVFITGISFADTLWIPAGIQTADWRQTAASDRAFVATIEHALGGHGMVLQIPYTEYPGTGGPGRILPYDHARPYVQSSANLQWSWGTVTGTEESRSMQSVAQLPPDSLISEVRKKGFRGLWIDVYGYADNAPGMPAKAIAALLGQDPLASPDGRYLFFNLTSAPSLPSPPPAESSAAPFAQAPIRTGGSCYVDSIERTPLFHINGWMADTDTGVVLPEIYVEISATSGKRVYLHGSRLPRGDVASHFNKPSLMQSGFVASGKLDMLPPGGYRVRILQTGPGSVEACATDFHVELR